MSFPAFHWGSPALRRQPYTTKSHYCISAGCQVPTATYSTKRRAPRKFVRMHPTPLGIELQTAVTTFELDGKTVHIHSLVHFADQSYYTALSSAAETVFYELITSSSNTTPPPYRVLKAPIAATPSARATAHRLQTTAQADALNLTHPRWYVADVPAEALHPTRSPLQLPSELPLRIVSAVLPCPELNLLALNLRAASAVNIIQLLKAPLMTKRRLLYAWRAERGTARAANASADGTTASRDDVAWNCVQKAHGELALLYGAWHSGRFCRRAEADGMTFVRSRWVTAMTVSKVEVTWRDVALCFCIGVVYCGASGWDWIAAAEHGFAGRWADVLGYLARHLAVFFVGRRWLEELG